jgi:autotransporter-associated beta strand protein
VAVFGDTTTAGGAVSNYNLTVGAGGASTGTVLFENTTAQSYTIGSADSTGITGTTAITKTGNGTVTFTGSNTYTGATTINAGKLVLGDAAADNFATSGVTVGANGTLAGSGTLSGTLSVSGLLAPGNGGTGTLAAGTTTWNGSGGIWEFELTSPGASDKLDITGNFTKGSGSVFQFNFMNSTPLSGTYTLIDWSGSTAFLASNFSFTGLSSAYNGSYFTINGSQLDFTAVPEPTSALAGLLITAGLLRRRRA